MSEVCIIGAGISGIIASKVCLSNNLIPFILEKSSSIGGIWKSSPTQIGVWNSLITNTSKYFLMFSDHPWPAETPTFPTHTHIINYLNSYIEKHRISQYIHFNTQVTLVARNGDGYDVSFSCGGEIATKWFKNVICASGFYSVLKDEFEGKEVFKGEILHSGYYREPSGLAGKRVVVVGKAFSSGDIAVEALKCAKSVTQVYRRPTICMDRYVHGVPYDFFMFGIGNRHNQTSLITTHENSVAISKLVFDMVGNPGEILEDWTVTDEDLSKGYFGFANHITEYFDAIKTKQIPCIKGDLKGFCETGLVLTNNQIIEADTVILTTGFYTNYSFFSEEIQQILDYDPKNQLAALTLYRATVHPSLPGLGFVGSFHGPFPGQFEIQSEVSVKWITGQLNVSNEELWEGVRLEKRCRSELKGANFIYEFGFALLEYFRILGIEIDYRFLEEIGYKNGIYCPVFYWKEREG